MRCSSCRQAFRPAPPPVGGVPHRIGGVPSYTPTGHPPSWRPMITGPYAVRHALHHVAPSARQEPPAPTVVARGLAGRPLHRRRNTRGRPGLAGGDRFPPALSGPRGGAGLHPLAHPPPARTAAGPARGGGAASRRARGPAAGSAAARSGLASDRLPPADRAGPGVVRARRGLSLGHRPGADHPVRLGLAAAARSGAAQRAGRPGRGAHGGRRAVAGGGALGDDAGRLAGGPLGAGPARAQPGGEAGAPGRGDRRVPGRSGGRGGRRAPPDRAGPARRRPAAPHLPRDEPGPGPAHPQGLPARRHAGDRRRARGGPGGHRRAARPGPGAAPGGPGGPRSGRGAVRHRGPGPAAGAPGRRAVRPDRPDRRGGRLLHRLRGAHQRGQARPGQQVDVSVRTAGGRLRLVISDDGVGGADASRGTGLTGLRKRAASVDGTLSVLSPLGGPTTITVELPCVL